MTNSIKEQWKSELAADGQIFTVLVTEEMFDFLSGADIKSLKRIFDKINIGIQKSGRPHRRYLVCSSNARCAEQIRELLAAEFDSDGHQRPLEAVKEENKEKENA